MTKEITNSEDIIDSRDVIARIEELQGERDSLQSAIDEAEGDEALGAAQAALAVWDAGEEASELKALQALASEAEGYADDWQHGEALIRDSHFTEYAEQLAEDCGMVTDGAIWPNNCIDWKEAARQLKQDYTSVDFDGVEYWIR